MKISCFFIIIFSGFSFSIAQPNWNLIKSNATFNVPDTSYNQPYLQSIQVPGWEDGLFMTRDAKYLYSTYLPLDAFSWITDLVLNPICFNFQPYYRPPLLGIDTNTNIFGCPNYMHSDLIISNRADTSQPFNPWSASNLQTSFSFDGGAHGQLLNADTFDVFVFTKDGPGTQSTDIMFMKNVPVNPTISSAVPVLSTPAQEDNPHIERLNDSTLLLFFDRDRYIYYSISNDNGDTWQAPILITSVLNDQAPYDVQPHLWNNGQDWWVYFCANNLNGVRCIYKSKQLITNNWNNWGPKELVIEPGMITGNYGTIFGVGEPTLSAWGDLSFVVVYGNNTLPDTTDVFDCDPWFLPKKLSPLTQLQNKVSQQNKVFVYPNPAREFIYINTTNVAEKVNVRLYDISSRVIIKEEFYNQKDIKLDLQHITSGAYFINVQAENFQVTTKIVLKN